MSPVDWRLFHQLVIYLIFIEIFVTLWFCSDEVAIAIDKKFIEQNKKAVHFGRMFTEKKLLF